MWHATKKIKNMKRITYLLFAAFAVVMTVGCEPKGFEPDTSGKARSIAVKEAVYVAASQSMQLSFKDNTELQLNVVTIPANIPVAFSNRRPEIMEVTSAGVLKPNKPGVDTLTVSATDGSGLSTRYVVNVIDHMVKATAINVAAEGANFQLKVGGTTFDLGRHVSLAPADTWDKTVTYTSGDPTLVTVDAAGIVTSAGKEGATTITIKTTDGSNLSRDVNVEVVGLVTRFVDVDRKDWTVSTQTHNDYGYMWDGGTQAAPVTGLPEHMFDGNAASYLSLVKPGGSMNGVAPPVGTVPSFTIDMKAEQEFEYIKWSHRNGGYTNPNGNGSVGGNTYNYLRVYGVRLEGSNDGETFTAIDPAQPAGADGTVVWIPQKISYVGGVTSAEDQPYIISVAKSKYRYIRVNLAVQSKNYGTAEGQYQYPDYPGAGSTGGNTMQIAEFGLGVVVIE